MRDQVRGYWTQHDEILEEENRSACRDLAIMTTQLAHIAMAHEGNCAHASVLNRMIANHWGPRALLLLETMTGQADVLLVDSMSVFDAATLVPALLAFPINEYKNANEIAEAKYAVLASLLTTCWTFEAPFLAALMADLMSALGATGSNPELLQHIVLSLMRVLPYHVDQVGDLHSTL
jgi:hypothetical protein